MLPINKRVEETRALLQRHLKLKEGAKRVLQNPEATPRAIEQANELIRTLDVEIEEFRSELYTLMAQVAAPEFPTDSTKSDQKESSESKSSTDSENTEKLLQYYRKQLQVEQEVKSGVRRMLEAVQTKGDTVNNELLLLYHDSMIKVEYLRMLIVVTTQKKNLGERVEIDKGSDVDIDGFSEPMLVDHSPAKIRERFQNTLKMLQGAMEIRKQDTAIRVESDKKSLLSLLSLSTPAPSQADELIEFLSQLAIVHDRSLKKTLQNKELSEDASVLNTFAKNTLVSGSISARFFGITDIDLEMIRDSKANQKTKTTSRSSSSEVVSPTAVYLVVNIDSKMIFTSNSVECGKFSIDAVPFEVILMKNKWLQLVVRSSVSNVIVGFVDVTLTEFLDGEPHKIKVPLEPQGYVYCLIQYFMPRPRKAKVIRQKKIFMKRAMFQDGHKLDEADFDTFLKEFRVNNASVEIKNEKPFAIPQKKSGPSASIRSEKIVPKAKPSAEKAQRILKGEYEQEFVQKGFKKEISLESFKFISVLGQGHFGKVLLAEHSKSKHKVALKTITKLSILETNDFEMLTIEKRVLMVASEYGHPFLVHLDACFTSDQHICYALEYVQAGDLMSHIHLELFSENRCIFYAACVILGLEFLHEIGVMYRDLKLDNIMMLSDGYVKLGDFGLCKTNMWHGTKTSTFCGTPEFIAPEILQFPSYNRSVDWWELGVLIYEMMLGEAPFDGADENEIFHSIVYDDVVLPSYLSTPARNIIFQLLEKNPAARLGSGVTDAQEIKAHPFFSVFNFCELENKLD